MGHDFTVWHCLFVGNPRKFLFAEFVNRLVFRAALSGARRGHAFRHETYCRGEGIRLEYG